MAAKLLDAPRSLMTPVLVARASLQTGESDAAISKGLAAVIPMLFSSIASRSDDTAFMSQLASLATKAAGAYDASSLPEQPAAVAPRIDPSVAGNWLSTLFGGGMASVVEGVARYAGVGMSASTSLFAIAAPAVLSYFGRLMRTEKLDVNGLATRLKSDRQALAAAVPTGLDAFLPEFSGKPGAAVRAVTDTMSSASATAARATSRPGTSWVLPLVIGAVALAGLITWGRGSTSEQLRNAAGDAVSSAIGTTGTTANFLTRTLPGNIPLRIPRSGMEDRLVDYLAAPSGGMAGPTFDFDRIGFETGSTTLTPASREQIGNIAKILTAYPNARVDIAGYTDNTGNEQANVALSRSRATSVMTVLRENGVAMDRMRAEGHGSQNPVADNETAASRARNRRVALTVTSR